MKNINLKIKSVGLFICPFSLLIFNTFAQAQTVVPAADGTGTAVTRNGNRYDIGGGSLSGDGANLFHSFQQFGLNETQIANFLTNPAIHNILGRITGGDASLINGLITVTGGNSNLFLINPAGIVFGPNASLNVPAAFTATTATNVGFGSNWFNATGANNFSTLVGTPSAFAFGVAQPGSIVNSGNLAVAPGQNLALLGGTVISTGNLSAPGGQITVAAVPGQNVIRISQPGHLLSLEVGSGTGFGNSQLIANPVSLPQLLTGTGTSPATVVAVAGDGTVRLVDSGLAVNSGDIAIAPSNLTQNSLNAANAEISAAGNLSLAGVQLNTTGNLTLKAGDTLRVRDNVTNPFLAKAGGNLHIQGDRAIDILTQNATGPLSLPPQFQSGRALSLVSNGIISGDAHFAAIGNFSIRNLSGMPGSFVSLFDPIISSEGDVIFGDYTGVSLKIEAKGSIIGEDITITGPDTSLNGNASADPDIAILTSTPALILRAGLINLANSPNFSADTLSEDPIFNSRPMFSSNLIVVENISAGGPVILSASGNVATRDINGGEIKLESREGAVIVGGQLTSSTINIHARNNIILTNDIPSAQTNNNIILISSKGNIETRSIDRGNSGDIEVQASGNVKTGELRGSSVTVNSKAGNIEVKGNTIANENITFTAFGNVNAGSLQGVGVKVNSSSGKVETDNTIATGNLTFTASDHVKCKELQGSSVTVNSKTGNIEVKGNTIATENITFTASGDVNSGNLQGIGVKVDSSSGKIATANTKAIGNLSLTASGNVNTGELQGSSVTVNSKAGNIEVKGNTTATENITFTASGDVNSGKLQGVGVKVDSSSGKIETTNTKAIGNLSLTASGNVNTGELQGSSVTVNSKAGNIEVKGNTTATENITFTASGDVNSGKLQGVGVNVNSSSGKIETANTIASGNLTLTASGNVNTGELQGSSVTVNSKAGNIEVKGNTTATESITFTASGDVNSGNLQGVGVKVDSSSGKIETTNTKAIGNLSLTASGNVNTGELQGSSVNINSKTGNIEVKGNTTATENITFTASGDVNSGKLQGVGVKVDSSSGMVKTDNINASAMVDLSAGKQIRIGAINFDSMTVDRIPTVNLVSDQNDISISSIKAPGGKVEIGTPGLVTVRDNLNSDTPISILTVGGNQPGSITINHGGGDTNPPIPFVVGDPAVNGTKGAIASNVDAIPQGQSFINSYTQGNIAIFTNNNQLTPTPPTPSIDSISATPPTPSIDSISATPPTPSIDSISATPPTTPITSISAITPTTPTTPTTQNSPLTSSINRQELNRVRSLFPEVRQPLTAEQLQNQNRISRDIVNPIEKNVSERIQNPRSIRNFINSNARQSVFQSAFRTDIGRNFDSGKIVEGVSLLEKSFSQEFSEYFGQRFSENLIPQQEIKQKLSAIGAETGTKPSLIYLFSRSEKLDLVLITASGSVIHQSVPEANREELMKVVSQFRSEITKPGVRRTTSYLPFSKQLYKWIIAPLEPTLKEQGIDTISFIADAGLRGFPFAALHDGKQFLIENYNISLIPSMNLTDTRYINVRNAQVLAMGASQFSDLQPLPAVPAEIAAISRGWPGITFLNEGFTLENLKQQHQSRPFGIIHLATHGEFRPGVPNNSFIQLWNSRLKLDQLRQLRLNNPQVNLLVLSACRTAVGDEKAELGFGGLAVQSGVQSALASLWYVSDEGTLGLMSEFYHQLKTAPIKAAALRQAQIAMLRGEVRLEGGRLRNGSRGAGVELPASMQGFADTKLSHPFYWSAFVMIGSPW
jgi:filamentous hemagglutinin family protein